MSVRARWSAGHRLTEASYGSIALGSCGGITQSSYASENGTSNTIPSRATTVSGNTSQA